MGEGEGRSTVDMSQLTWGPKGSPDRCDAVCVGGLAACVTRNSNSKMRAFVFCMSWCADFEFRVTHRCRSRLV